MFPTRFRSYGAAPFVCGTSYKDLAPTEPFFNSLLGRSLGLPVPRDHDYGHELNLLTLIDSSRRFDCNILRTGMTDAASRFVSRRNGAAMGKSDQGPILSRALPNILSSASDVRAIVRRFAHGHECRD